MNKNKEKSKSNFKLLLIRKENQKSIKTLYKFEYEFNYKQ